MYYTILATIPYRGYMITNDTSLTFDPTTEY